MIDSFHDRRSAYEFAVNPAGVKSDTYWYNDTNNDQGWDAVWDVAVSRNDRGWRAEFRVPFSQLRFPVAADSTFGLAIVREIGRLNETTTWPLLAKSATGFVSSFGELTGLQIGRSQKRLELVPYVVGDVKTQPVEDANPLQDAKAAGAEVGVDLKYALKPSLTLTATVNPDFGQVEADPAVVNLSAFETFFSERRPFFVEGGGIFQFNVDCNDGSCSGLFYSRRIGRAPRGAPSLGEGEFSDAPGQTTILGAAKLTGRAGGFSIGGLSAITADEDAVIALGTAERRQTVEPLTGYSVMRARREFQNQSSVGFIATATNRNLDEFTRFLPAQAYTGGVDVDWRVKKKYSVQGFFASSNVRGDAEAIAALQESNVHSFQRPDSEGLELDPTRTALNGAAAMVGFNKIAGERVRFSSNVSMKSPGFDVNDLGFQQRADTRNMSNWMQWRNERPSKYLRSFRFNLNQWAGWNFDGDLLNSGVNVNAHAVFPNQWSTGMGLNRFAQPFDDRATRGGPGAFRSAQRSMWAYFNSDERKPVSVNVFGFVGKEREGSTNWEIGPDARLAADFVHLGQRRRLLQSQRSTVAMGREHRRRAVCVRPDRSAHGVADDAPQLHGHAEPFRAALRAAVRLGGRLRRVQAAGRTAVRATTADATARSTISAIQTSTTARSAPPTWCAGSTVPARRCSWSGSRAARTSTNAAGSTSAATSPACSARRRATSSW